MRAAGGVGINTNAPNAVLAVDGGNSVARIAVNSNTPTANAGLNLRQDGVGRWSIAAVSTDGDLTFFREGAGGGSRLFIDGGGANAGYVGIGSAAPQYPLHMASGAHVTAGGTWTNASSRALKTDFADVDRTALLEALAALPITSWSYRAEDSALRHLGPTAEDFYAAFGLGADDGAAIGTVDADGVALVAIQALHRLNQRQQAQLASQQQQIERLEVRLTALEQRGQPDWSPWLLPAGALMIAPAGGGWAIRNVLTHLRDAQDVLAFRLDLFLQEEHPLLEAKAVWTWAANEEERPPTALEIFQTYRAARGQTLHKLEQMPLTHWWRTGRRQEFGEVTLRQQANYFAAHELTHLSHLGALRRI